MKTFLDKIDEGFNAFRKELTPEANYQFADLITSLKAHVLTAAAEHFGDCEHETCNNLLQDLNKP